MAGTTKLMTAGGGGVSLTPASSIASDVTVQIPASNGTVITTASSGKVIPTAALPAGTVLQVVNVAYATAVSTSSNTRSDTGLTASITPTSGTSKILVFVDVCGVAKDASNASINGSLFLVRNSTVINQFDYTSAYTGTAIQNRIGSVSTNYLDSPATTSATTYKVQFASNGNYGPFYINKDSDGIAGSTNTSTITLMEIAA